MWLSSYPERSFSECLVNIMVRCIKVSEPTVYGLLAQGCPIFTSSTKGSSWFIQAKINSISFISFAFYLKKLLAAISSECHLENRCSKRYCQCIPLYHCKSRGTGCTAWIFCQFCGVPYYTLYLVINLVPMRSEFLYI